MITVAVIFLLLSVFLLILPTPNPALLCFAVSLVAIAFKVLP